MSQDLYNVKHFNHNLKSYTKKLKTRTEEIQKDSLSLGESLEYKIMNTFETKAILAEPFAKVKAGTKETRSTLAYLSKSALILLEIIKYEAINKFYFKSLGDGGTQTNGKYASVNLLCLKYEWYLKYFEECFGYNTKLKPLSNKNYYSVLKELVKADIIYQTEKNNKSFYYYNLQYFCVGDEIEIYKKYCEKNNVKLPKLLITEDMLKETNDK